MDWPVKTVESTTVAEGVEGESGQSWVRKPHPLHPVSVAAQDHQEDNENKLFPSDNQHTPSSYVNECDQQLDRRENGTSLLDIIALCKILYYGSLLSIIAVYIQQNVNNGSITIAARLT